MKQRVNPSTLTPERRRCPTEMQSIEDSTRQSQSIRYRIRQAVDGKQCPAWFLREVIPRWMPYWLTDSNWHFRFDEKNCCEDHTCQDESGSEFKRLQETHHSVTTQLEKYRPNRSLCGCINGAYMNESALGMNSCTNRMSLTLESGCINNAPALYEPHKGNDRVCANSQVKYRILHTSTCLQRWNKDEKRLQSRHASAAHTKLRHSVEGIAGLEGHRDSWDDC